MEKGVAAKTEAWSATPADPKARVLPYEVDSELKSKSLNIFRITQPHYTSFHVSERGQAACRACQGVLRNPQQRHKRLF